MPTAHDFAMWLVTALAVVVVYLAVAKVAIEEAHASAVAEQKQTEQLLLACLNGQLYLLTDTTGTKCRLSETVPINLR
jgi:uncharacterized membrane protein SirB2